jgi:1,5-anhydro-D-fructose reductase (1,5-anhydro-D-mannitol-forming)
MQTEFVPAFGRIIHWGIIGCGNVTEVKSGPAYKKTDGFELTAVMRRDFEKAKDYANRHNVKKFYSCADDLINDPEIEAVYIATPPDSHMLYGLKVAVAGKICCIEKPMSPCYADSLAIYEAFKNKDTPLFVAYYRRSLPRFLQVKKWIESGKIGEVRHVDWHLFKTANKLDFSGEYNWRTDSKVAPGGYFDDLASHGLDLFSFLLGDITDARGISLNQQGLYSAKDAISACWVHEKGATGAGSWNFGCGFNEDQVIISGNRGEIKFSVFENNPLEFKNETNEMELMIENPVNIQLFHVENMRNQLLSRNFKHPSTGLTALHTSWVMDKILGTF